MTRGLGWASVRPGWFGEGTAALQLGQDPDAGPPVGPLWIIGVSGTIWANPPRDFRLARMSLVITLMYVAAALLGAAFAWAELRLLARFLKHREGIRATMQAGLLERVT